MIKRTKHQFSQVNMPAILRLSFSGVLLLAAPILLSCSFFGPPKVASKAKLYEPEVSDPASYKAARAKLRPANQAFGRHNYAKALRLSDESLAIYETFEGHYLKGSSLFQTGRTEDALRSFQKAERLNPDDPQLLLTMGTAFTTAGDLESALKRYQRLHEKYPNEPVYAYKLGTTYKNLRRYPEAYEALKKADKPGFRYLDQTYLQLGDTALELKKYEESRLWFAKARSQNPKLKAASEGEKNTRIAEILEKGNRAFAKKSYAEARSFYQEGARLEPKSPAPLLLLGSVALAEKKPEEAKKPLLRALKLDPKNSKGYDLLASAEHQLGEYRRALTTLKQGLAIAPESYVMHNKKGLVHRDRGELSQAISSYYKALEIKPDYVQARSNLAFALLEARRYTDARREFDLASKQAPEDANLKNGIKLVDTYIHLDRGDRFLENRKFRAAAEEYALAQKIAPKKPVVHNSLGRLAFARGRTKEAARHFETSLKLDPKNVAALQGMLRIHSKNRNRAKVRSTLARIRKLTKNDLTAALALGRLKEDEGKLKEAERYYQGLLKSRPNEQRIKRRLGYVYYKQGLRANKQEDFRSALARFEKAEKYNPEIPQLPDTLKIVRENIRYKALLPKLKRAESLFSQARYREALPLFESVYTRLKRPLILVKISNCYIALGKEEKGIRLLEESSGSTREELPIKEAIYTHFLNKKQVLRARKGFENIVKDFPDAHFSLYKLGVVDLIQKKYGSAIRHFSESLIHKPGFSVAHIGRGVAYYEKGDKERARQEFESARKGLHHKELANFNLGVLYLNDGVLKRAEEIFLKLLKDDPRNQDAYYQLSFIYFAENRLDDAESELRKALKLSSEPRFYHGLARIAEKRYLKQKTPENTSRLRALYKEIVTRYPNTRYAEEARAKMLRVLPESRVVQPYPRLPRPNSAPVLVNGDLLYLSAKRLVSVSSTSKRLRFSVRLPSRPKKLLIDHLAFVLLRDRILGIDLITGQTLRNIPLSGTRAGAVDLIGTESLLGVVYGGKEPYLALYDAEGKIHAKSTPLARSRYFYFQGAFYSLLPMGRELAVSRLQISEASEKAKAATHRLSVEKNVQLAFGRRNVRPRLLLDKTRERFHLYVPGSLVFSLNANLKKLSQFRLPGTATRLLASPDGRLLVPSATKLSFYREGKKSDEIKLPVPLASGASLQLQEKHILYVGRDQKLHRLNYKGKEIWTLPVPRARWAKTHSQFWSVYY